jgi:predicted ATPase
MITLIEALNYRCLRYVQRPMKPFHVLVGPNASGKTTFLDVIGFLGDLVSKGFDAALSARTSNPEELLFRRQGEKLELAIEARIPNELRQQTSKPELDRIRYEVAIGFEETRHQLEFKAETLLLKKAAALNSPQRSLFPMPPNVPDSLLSNPHQRDNKIVMNKAQGGNDNFYSEKDSRSGRRPSIRLGPQKSALGHFPVDERQFPVAAWFRECLATGVQRFVLNSLAIKHPSPPMKFSGFSSDGSNLPWVVDRLRKEDPKRYRAWLAHLRTALPDLVDIATTVRENDRHCYMIYEYEGDLKVPSWLVSDGTLRLTALTLPAYLADLQGIYLIEEPENGTHPKAVATAYDSLSSVYDAQVLLATHSPVVLSKAGMDDILCFAKNDDGSTDVVLGPEHPLLQQWQGTTDPGTLLASGVLG